MKDIPISPNVKLIILTIAGLFTLLTLAAFGVGWMEGSFGCGGGTVGSIITLGGVVFGFMAGLAVKFADGFVNAIQRKGDTEADESE